MVSALTLGVCVTIELNFWIPSGVKESETRYKRSFSRLVGDFHTNKFLVLYKLISILLSEYKLRVRAKAEKHEEKQRETLGLQRPGALMTIRQEKR